MAPFDGGNVFHDFLSFLRVQRCIFITFYPLLKKAPPGSNAPGNSEIQSEKSKSNEAFLDEISLAAM